MPIFDLHCDTVVERLMCRGDAGLESCRGHLSLDMMKSADIRAQVFAVFVLTNKEAENEGVTTGPFDFFLSAHGIFERELEKNSGTLARALNASDIERNAADHKISAILSVEDGVLVEGELSRINELHRLGVRLITLTWNYENCFGYPHSTNPTRSALGLKEFGREAVAEMNGLGMIIDVSHLSDGGFWDVARLSSKPFIASHSCCRALCRHSRNLSDEMLRAIGERGGVVGVNYYSRFLRDGSDSSTVSDIIRHMRHIANKAGADAVSLGSDFDGFSSNLEFRDCSGLPLLVRAIDREFKGTQCDAITFKNAMRVFRDCTE